MRIQLLADLKYRQAFSHYLSHVADIQLVSDKPDIIVDSSFLNPRKKIDTLRSVFPIPPIISNSLSISSTTVWHAIGEKAQVVGVPMLPHYFDRQLSVEYSLPYQGSIKKNTHDAPELFLPFLSLLGKIGEQVNDAIAGVFPRTLAMIINEAAFAVQESVATAADIDTAMKLGTNYPKGPLAWCDEIGAEAIVAILDALAGEYGSERYRVAALLRRYAESGMKFIGQRVDEV